MAIDISYVRQRGPRHWIVSPSGDGTGVTDADNLQLVLDMCESSALPCLLDLAEGTFYVKKQLNGISNNLKIKGAGIDMTTIVAGTSTSLSMDLNSREYARNHRYNRLPRLLCFWVSDSSKLPYDVEIKDLTITAPVQEGAHPDHLYASFSRPAMTMQAMIQFDGRELAGYRLFKSVSLSGPVGNTMTVSSGAIDAFEDTDVGKYVTIAGAANPSNNGKFLITAKVDPFTLEYTNAAGVAEAVIDTVCAIGEPDLIPISGGKARVRNVKTIAGHAANGIANMHIAICIGSLEGLTVEGAGDDFLEGIPYAQLGFDLMPMCVDLEVRDCIHMNSGVGASATIKHRVTPPLGVPYSFEAPLVDAGHALKNCEFVDVMHSPFLVQIGVPMLRPERFSALGCSFLQTKNVPVFPLTFSAFSILNQIDDVATLFKGVATIGGPADTWFDPAAQREWSNNTFEIDSGVTIPYHRHLQASGTVGLKVEKNTIIGRTNRVSMNMDSLTDCLIRHNSMPTLVGGDPKNGNVKLIACDQVVIEQNDYQDLAFNHVQIDAACTNVEVTGDSTFPNVVNLAGAGATLVNVGTVSTNPADLFPN